MDNQYLERYRSLFSALDQGNFDQAKQLLPQREESFVQFMDDYITSKGLVRQAIMRRADIAVSFGYKLLTGEKHTKNRNVILRLCIAMQMELDDVQKALCLYGMNGLGNNQRDNIISAGIVYRRSVDEIDDWLLTLKLSALLDSYDR